MSPITHVCRKTNWTPLTVSMGNPKIHIPQNCKVKLVYLRERLKARVKLLYVKESSWFICLRRLCSVSISYRTCHVRIQRIGHAKTQTTQCTDRADWGYVHTKPNKFENATFAAKTDKMFSVHINRFQTVSLSVINNSSAILEELRQSHMTVVRSAFSKSSVFAVHTNTLSRRFQIYPLWRAFSKSSVCGHRKRRFSVDGRPIRIKKSCVFKFIRLSVDVAWIFSFLHLLRLKF